MRQIRIKELAAAADARWASQKSSLDSPNMQQPVPAIGVRDPGGYANATEDVSKQGVRSAVRSPQKVGGGETTKLQENEELNNPRKTEEPPWKAAPATPGEDWQPKAWKPGPRRRK